MQEMLTAAVRRLLPSAAVHVLGRVHRYLRLSGHRLRWLASGRRGVGIGIGSFAGNRVAYRLHSADALVLGHSFDHDIFLTAVPEYALPEDAVVLDVGAHIGTFSLLAANQARRGQVFAIEASRENFELLSVNVALSRRTNLVAEHLALAGRNGVVQLHHDPDGNYGHSITTLLSSTSETVNGVTLERYLYERGIASVDLAKFNCEGAEFPILLSTPTKVLRRIKKAIVLYHCDMVEESAGTLVDRLAASGFTTRLMNQTSNRGWIIATRNPPP